MPNAPMISVVMPVYNAARHLRSAIDSILAQTFGDFEFLCIDDGSTDRSPAILRDYASRDPRVRIITKPNGGVTSAIIAGVRESRGQFIARMDADDEALPERFALQIEFLRANPACIAVGCRVTLIDEEGREVEQCPIFDTHEQIVASLWEGNGGALPHFGVTMRREALERVGGYNAEFRTAQDLDLFLRLSEIGRLANVPRPLMRYRVHEGGVSAARAQEQVRNAREILRRAYARRGLKPPRNLLRRDKLVAHRIRWGWQALEEGRVSDARMYARQVFREAPFRRYAWQLGFHALLGNQRIWARNVYRGLMKRIGRRSGAPRRTG